MYSNIDYLRRKTGKAGVARPQHLRYLVDELNQFGNVRERVEQILSNLANFAYDPLNHCLLLELNVDEIFWKHLNQKLSDSCMLSSLTGLCNLGKSGWNEQRINEFLTFIKNGDYKDSEMMLVALGCLSFAIEKFTDAFKSDLLDTLEGIRQQYHNDQRILNACHLLEFIMRR
ncbi:hypothetical protein GJ496_003412 [Pomphorhynchus laevis]|nr:hypothetical protein GJ496_003412 [Pomphorhynchus laevis]